MSTRVARWGSVYSPRGSESGGTLLISGLVPPCCGPTPALANDDGDPSELSLPVGLVATRGRALGVDVVASEGVGVGVGEGVGVRVAVGEGVGVRVAVAVGVGVGIGGAARWLNLPPVPAFDTTS